MSSGGKSESKTTIDPAQLAMLQQNYGVAQGTAAKLGQSYTGQIAADPTQSQLNSRQMFRDISNNNVGGDALSSAITGARGFMDFSLPTYTPTNVTAGQISDADLSKYLNPFTSNVIDTTGRDLERQRQIAGVNDNQHATVAGAFGGSRHGVADSLTNEAYDRNAGTLFAGLRQTGYTNAQDMARSDIDRRFAADTANQGAGYNAAVLNQAGATGAANIRLGAGANLANYSNQQIQQAGTRAGFMQQAGDQEQAQRQAELTAQYQEFIRQLTGSAQGQQILNQALGAFPAQTNTSQTTKQDMTGQIIGAGLTAAMFASDRRLKKNIERIGKTRGGLNLYSYEYIWGDEPWIGVMADEVEKVIPSAVIVGPRGFKMVDYSQVV